METIIGILFLVTWIWGFVWAGRRKGFLGFIFAFFGWWLGVLLACLLPDIDDKERRGKFRCGICFIEYREEFYAAKTRADGEICRFCLDKKQKGEH